MIDPNILKELQAFGWQKIIDYGCSLDDCNDRQWRFLKGLLVELAVEKHSNGNLIYVGQDHKDFDWPARDKTVELKSQLSDTMYTRKAQTRKNFSFKLNNSNGTNKKEKIDAGEVCDYTLVVRSDGSFVIDRDTVMANAHKTGDGFEVKISCDQINEVSGRVVSSKKYQSTIKRDVIDVARKSIPD